MKSDKNVKNCRFSSCCCYREKKKKFILMHKMATRWHSGKKLKSFTFLTQSLPSKGGTQRTEKKSKFQMNIRWTPSSGEILNRKIDSPIWRDVFRVWFSSKISVFANFLIASILISRNNFCFFDIFNFLSMIFSSCFSMTPIQ